MKAHLATESPVNSLLKTKQSRASVISRSRVMKFLNEVFFDVYEEDEKGDQSEKAKSDLGRLTP